MVAAIALILKLEESTDGEEELGILVVGLGSSEALLRGCFAESKYECLRRAGEISSDLYRLFVCDIEKSN